MRITHVVENLNRGGLECVVLDLASEQTALGHACQVVCLFEPGQLATIGVNVVACGKKRRGVDVRALRRLREAVRAHASEVVHTHNAVAHYYTVLATLLLRVRRINTRHGMGNYPFNLRREFLYRLALSVTRAVVVVCDAARHNFLRYRIVPVAKAMTIPNGIRVDLFRPGDEAARCALRRLLGWDDDALVLGCVARLNEAKDHETLLRAFRMVHADEPRARLVLIGDGALRDRLEALCGALGLKAAVRFLGDRGDVPQLLPGFDLFVLASLTEGYSIALLEACAAGLPIVATKVGGNAEIVHDGQNGLLVPPRDPQAFARATRRLLADVGLRERVGAEGRRFVEQQGSVRIMVARYLSLYERIRDRTVACQSDEDGLRLVVITNLFPNPLEPLRSTFNERQVLEIARVASVTVLSPVDWWRVLAFKREGRYAVLRGCNAWKEVRVRYPTYFHLPKVARWLNGFAMLFSLLPAWLRTWRERPQAIYATWAFPDGFAAAVLGRLFGVPVVIKVHGSDVEVLARSHIRRWLAVWALNRARAVVAIGHYLRARLIEYGVAPERIAVVYNGIDAERFQPRDRVASREELGLPRDAHIVLYVGNLKLDKGPLDLLAAVEPICDGRHLYVYFAGEGPARAALEAGIIQRGLGRWIRVLGCVDHALIPVWINAADVLCLPSYHEGVPNVILEAIACGVPVLATRVGGIPEVVSPEAGLMVPPKDPAVLRDALLTMLERRWSREAIARSLVAGAWDDNAARIITLIRQGTGLPN